MQKLIVLAISLILSINLFGIELTIKPISWEKGFTLENLDDNAKICSIMQMIKDKTGIEPAQQLLIHRFQIFAADKMLSDYVLNPFQEGQHKGKIAITLSEKLNRDAKAKEKYEKCIKEQKEASE